MGYCVGRWGPSPPLRVAPRGGRERSLARAREERRRAAPQAGAMLPRLGMAKLWSRTAAGLMRGFLSRAGVTGLRREMSG